ncbi:MAG: cistern family PEP-CTERM protein [Marinobacter sp.]|uniref:cistern family PEP-CTERM protein n=1 Tax=Marinobacter sp. TaxID=50741 RepID=UPI00397715F8
MSIFRKTTLVLAGLMIAGGANATMISFDTVGDTGTVHYGGNIDQTDVEGLSASTSFELKEIKNSSFVFDVMVANNTNSLWEEARVSAIGFNVDPDLDSASVDGNSTWFTVLNSQFPNQFGPLDICIKDGGGTNSCQGGGGDGVEIGDSTSFLLELGFDGLPEAVTLDNFGVRWQSLVSEELGYGVDDDEASGTGTPVSKVPEPGTLGLFGLGVLGLTLLGRRRRMDSQA